MGKQLINTGDGETCLHSDTLTDLARNINTFLPAIESWAGGAPALDFTLLARPSSNIKIAWEGSGPGSALRIVCFVIMNDVLTSLVNPD